MKPVSRRLEVWNDFRKGENKKFVTYQICKKDLKFFGNTINLNFYLKRVHPL